MKILMLTPYLPYPLFSGGQVRSYNIIKELSKKHDVTLFAVTRSKEEDEYIPELGKFCKKVVTSERGKAFSFTHIILSGATLLPFILAMYQMPKLQKAIDEELKNTKYDLIHVETFYLMHNLPAGRHGLPKTTVPVVLFEQNIEHDVYKKFAKSFNPAFVRPLLYLDVYKIKKWEEFFWKKADALVVMSEADKKFVNRDAFVCGNGADVEKFRVKSEELRVNKKEKRVLFIGSFKWIENRDAATWILKEIWPLISKNSELRTQNLKLWIVGKNIPQSIKELTSDESVIFDENAPEDTAEVFRQADLLLAPIRVGGGTSFKILEAMAAGVPVVTTSFGISGIGAGDREDVLIADDVNNLAKNVIEVLHDTSLRQKITQNARKLVEEKYDWEIIVKNIEEIYQSVVR